MARTVIRVPSQKLRFDPFRTLKKIHFKKRDGVWCSASVFLGNVGEGGSANLILSGLKDGVEDFVISLGSDGDGNGAFWNIRADGPTVSNDHFNQHVTLSDGSTMQAYGVREFDGGDNHNGSQFFFKAPPNRSFYGVVDATPQVAAPPGAEVYSDPFTPTVQNAISHAAGVVIGGASFQFDTTAKTVTLI